MMKTKWYLLILILLCCFACPACSSDNEIMIVEDHVPVEGDVIIPSDYANPENWLSIPEPSMPADVFVLYPTTYSAGETGKNYASIEDPGMRAGAAEFFENKASAFKTAGNMFAPYYRQLDARWLLCLPVDEQKAYVNGIPKTDVLAAFDYYIKNLNPDRPFMLVSHSQGSSMAKEILFDYLGKNPELLKRMVAAYVIGYSVTAEELAKYPHIKFAQSADDTGVVISYNTEAAQIDGKNPVWLPGAIAINPINWSRDSTAAFAAENLGSYINQGQGYERVLNLADASVHTERGVVICATVDKHLYSVAEPMRNLFPLGVYHGYDILFYYYNLRQNAENRVSKFLEEKSH